MRPLSAIPHDQDARRLALVLLLTLALAALQPYLWGKVFEAAAGFRNRQTEQAQLANVQRLTEAIRSADGAQQTLLDQAEVAFPPLAATPLIVERLEALAENRGLTLQLTSLTDPATAAAGAPKVGLRPFDVELTVVGHPSAVLAFFDAVEHMQELTSVETWQMTAAENPPVGDKLYTLTMKVRFFLQPS